MNFLEVRNIGTVWLSIAHLSIALFLLHCCFINCHVVGLQLGREVGPSLIKERYAYPKEGRAFRTQFAHRMAYPDLVATILVIGVLGYLLDNAARILYRRRLHSNCSHMASIVTSALVVIKLCSLRMRQSGLLKDRFVLGIASEFCSACLVSRSAT